MMEYRHGTDTLGATAAGFGVFEMHRLEGSDCTGGVLDLGEGSLVADRERPVGRSIFGRRKQEDERDTESQLESLGRKPKSR